MFNLTLKSDNELISMTVPKTVFVVCSGCDEVVFPKIDLEARLDATGVAGADFEVVESFYVCNLEHFEVVTQCQKALFDSSEHILVYSCGAGVQQMASYFPEKNVFPLCDTHILPGFQGLTPSEFDCALCGDCHLNKTGAVCPVTSCAKSLINGACGGSKNGMCEVDSDMACGWELIHKRINMR